MKIKDILAKLAKKEQLTDDESKFLGEYDPDKAVNDAAAAARRKAEEAAEAARVESDKIKTQLSDLQKKLDDADKGKMSEAQKAKAEQDDLKKQLADLQNKFETSEADKARLARQAKVDEIIRGSGIQFVEGVDKSILTTALSGAFKDVKDDDLVNDDVTKPIIEKFRVGNKAVIIDQSGHGSGGQPRNAGEGAPSSGGKDLSSMSAEERASQLQKLK